LNKYTLSLKADKDLSDIYDYTIFKFGQDQAEAYLTELEDTLSLLSKNINMGETRTDLSPRLKSFVYKYHTIFYDIEAEGIYVLRVMHHSRDIKNLW
jgi:toxin ParE1/3/4